VNLGQFAGYDDAQIWTPDGFKIGQRFQNAVRGFIENQRARGFGFSGFLGQRFEAAAAGSGLFRQKSDEVKLRGGQA
jgi:hypothetical protein